MVTRGESALPFTVYRLLLSLGALIAISACSNQPAHQATPTVERVLITVGQTTISVGESVALTALVLTTHGAPMGVAWTSSDPVVATVSESGKVLTHHPGEARISAISLFDPMKMDSITIRVLAPDSPPPTMPKIESVSPNPILSSDEEQDILIYGSDFAEHFRVEFGFPGGHLHVPGSEVRVLDSASILVRAVLNVPGPWTVTVSNGPRDLNSAPYPFLVHEASGLPEPPEEERFSLVATSSHGGYILSSPSGIDEENAVQDYSAGTEVVLLALAREGHIFTRWTGDCEGTARCVLSMTTNRAVAAEFALENDSAPEPVPPTTDAVGKWLSSSDTYLQQYDVYGDHMMQFKPGRIFIDYDAGTWIYYNNFGLICMEGFTSGWDLITDSGSNMVVHAFEGAASRTLTLRWTFTSGDHDYVLDSYLWGFEGQELPEVRGSFEDCLPPPLPPYADYGTGWLTDGGDFLYCYHRIDNAAIDASGIELRYYADTDNVALRINRMWTLGDPPVFRNGLGENDHVIVLRGLGDSPILMPSAAGWVDTGDSRPNYEWVEIREPTLVRTILDQPRKWVFRVVRFFGDGSYTYFDIPVEQPVLEALQKGFGAYCPH